MKILIVTGSSGGHIFPALAILEALKQKNPAPETLLVLPKKNILCHPELSGQRVNFISVRAFNLALKKKNISGLLNFFRGFFESASILSYFEPDVVVGFGSIACLPLVFLAWLGRKRIILHEQNVIPGRANRMLAICADKICLSFQESLVYFPNCPGRLIVTGNPLRGKLKPCGKASARQYFGLAADRFTLLVMGGSQGSRRINAEFMRFIAQQNNPLLLQVIHLVGEKDAQELENAYRRLGVDARVFSFLQDMHYAYSASDLALCRAGATTVAEIAHFGVPAIFIPYPFAYRHQLKNAEALSQRGAAIIIKEENLSAEELKNQILALRDNPARLEKMRLTLAGCLLQQAAERLTRVVVEAL